MVSRCDVCKETQPEIFALPVSEAHITHSIESLQEGDDVKGRGGLRLSCILNKP